MNCNCMSLGTDSKLIASEKKGNLWSNSSLIVLIINIVVSKKFYKKNLIFTPFVKKFHIPLLKNLKNQFINQFFEIIGITVKQQLFKPSENERKWIK